MGEGKGQEGEESERKQKGYQSIDTSGDDSRGENKIRTRERAEGVT